MKEGLQQKKDTKVASFEEAKSKKKAKDKEILTNQKMTIYEAVEALDVRVCQLIDIEQKLLDKVGDLECRLDTNGFPPGQSHWAGFKFKPDGTLEKQKADEFIQTKTKLVGKPRK